MKKYSLILTLLLFACAGPFRGRSGQDGPIPYQTILSGTYSLADSFSVRLIKNQNDWDETWMIAKGRIDPLPDIPTVDFQRQYVIAAFMGQRPSSGYSIEITGVERAGKKLKVYVTKYETPGMLTVITSPFYLIRIPRGNFDLEVISSVSQ